MLKTSAFRRRFERVCVQNVNTLTPYVRGLSIIFYRKSRANIKRKFYTARNRFITYLIIYPTFSIHRRTDILFRCVDVKNVAYVKN
jgi:hypothetical protein